MDLQGKKILVIGLANRKSIAWGTIQILKKKGARIGICYYLESNLKRVRPLAEEVDADFYMEVDATNDSQIKELAVKVKDVWGTFDGLVHSIAFSPMKELECRFHECTRAGFFETLDVSSFSLVALVQKLRPFFNESFSVVSMSYYGAQKVLPGYNLMGVAKAALETITKYLAEDLGREGVRVNSISAGAIFTLAAAGIPDFSDFLSEIKTHSPLKANISTQDVGSMVAFLMSPESKMITGQTMYVDAGMSIIAR